MHKIEVDQCIFINKFHKINYWLFSWRNDDKWTFVKTRESPYTITKEEITKETDEMIQIIQQV